MPANGYDHSQSCLLFTAALLQFIRIPAAQAFGVECITLLTIPLELVTASLAVASFAVSYAVQPVVRDYARRDRYYLIQRFIPIGSIHNLIRRTQDKAKHLPVYFLIVNHEDEFDEIIICAVFHI